MKIHTTISSFLNEAKKNDIGQDFLDKIDNKWYEDAAESHIDSWKERYSQYKNKKDVSFDLKMNHDPSLEIERAEDELGRKLTDTENDMLVDKFNKAVYKIIDLSKLKRGY